jgi:cysteine synthase
VSAAIASSALSLIGRTPLVALDRVHPGPGRIVAKAEFLQPGGSVKDRAAQAILLSARKDGRLRDGGLVVEMTSGNMGAGLAVACAALGHPLLLTMSTGNSPQRARMLRALGAELELVEQVSGTPGKVTGEDLDAAIAAAQRLTAERKGFYVDQFHAPEGHRAHEETTGREIWEQSGGRIDAWVMCVGTGATFQGVSRALKSFNSSIHCVAVEPAGYEPLGGKPITKRQHLLQGSGYGAVPPIWDNALMDEAIAVSDEEAEHWRTQLAIGEGLHVGYSAAANVCAASKVLRSGALAPDSVVATVLCDTGLKY